MPSSPAPTWRLVHEHWQLPQCFRGEPVVVLRGGPRAVGLAARALASRLASRASLAAWAPAVMHALYEPTRWESARADDTCLTAHTQ